VLPTVGFSPATTVEFTAAANTGGELRLPTGFSGSSRGFNCSYLLFGKSMPTPTEWRDDRIVVEAPRDFGTNSVFDFFVALAGCIVGPESETRSLPPAAVGVRARRSRRTEARPLAELSDF
jgi:hypothetical protein